MNDSSADIELAAVAASHDALLLPRVSLELLLRRRSDLVFLGLTDELSACRPVSVAARNLDTTAT